MIINEKASLTSWNIWHRRRTWKCRPEAATSFGIAAGRKMQALVVDTDEDAARAIDFLNADRLAGLHSFLLTKWKIEGLTKISVAEVVL